MKKYQPIKSLRLQKLPWTVLLLMLIFAVVTPSVSQAQLLPLPNGTLTTQQIIDEIQANLADERLMPFDPENPDLNEILTFEVFIVRNNLGELNFSLADLSAALLILNKLFEPVGISFKTDKITEVPEYEYSLITHQDSTKELEIKYAHRDKINLFLVDSIIFDGFEFYGYTFYPTEPDRNFIFLRKKYILNYYLPTLMGSFFGLLFTHEKMGGMEFVSESNCETSGDYICDTYADPGLFGVVDTVCHYQGASRDPEGQFYIPSVANIMSESPDTCKCIFTDDQYRRMKYYLFNLRDYLR